MQFMIVRRMLSQVVVALPGGQPGALPASRRGPRRCRPFEWQRDEHIQHGWAGTSARRPTPPRYRPVLKPRPQPVKEARSEALMSMVEARIYRQHAATSREIAFIDPGVADLGDLLRGLRR